MKLKVAAGVKRINVDTQYMFLNILTEMPIPKKCSSLRGICAVLRIEERSDRGRLHKEDTPEGWDARFESLRASPRNPKDPERTVEIVVRVDLGVRRPRSNGFEVPLFINACTHGWISNDEDAKLRESSWSDSVVMLNKKVQSYQPPPA